MCGIVGFIDERKKMEKKKLLEQMMQRIVHRGPDSEGKYIDAKIALGFRRLSIIDLKGGSQPITNETDDLIIVFNGEIYNFQSLRKELEKKGHVFKTNTDTEVILHGYEQYQEKIVSKLRGMFAFVIWNKKEKVLFGARDHFGIKPFYYTEMNGAFLFGSEIKSFLPHPDFHKELNAEALRPYLVFQYSVLEETFFKDVYKLEPGHYFTYKDSKLKIVKYYDVNYDELDKPLDEFMREIDKTVKKSVEAHKISDVKVGSFLSSGIDSSYITSCLKPDQTFSVGFSQKGYNEAEEASVLSQLLHIENVNKTIKPSDFFKELKNIQYYSDEPHANLSAVPLYFLSALAREHVTVVLSGEGADELFGGYDTYRICSEDLHYRKLPAKFRHTLAQLSENLPHFKGQNFLVKNGFTVEEHYIGQAHIFPLKQATSILKDKYRNSKTPQEITKPYFEKVKDKDDIVKMQYLDMHLWLPQDILLKADKMTMAHSLELRVPFLDKEVMDLAQTIPTEWKVNHGVTKYVLRKTALNTLPEEWANRPKLGFMVPFSYWIREEKYYQKVKKMFEQDFVTQFFNRKKILKLLEQHYKKHKNNARKIYTIYAFLLWYQVYFIEEK